MPNGSLINVARADYERKRAAVILKLLLSCHVEDGRLEVEFDEEAEKLTILTTCSACRSRGPESKLGC